MVSVLVGSDRRSYKPKPKDQPTYIDVFAGCGGLSLGLHRAGWKGIFAVEKDAFAFGTLQANFLSGSNALGFDWPEWLDQRPWTVEGLIKEHRSRLDELQGKVDLLAGGPPCQGFSSAGRRRGDDPRNSMIDHYIELVNLLQPRVLLLENVRGFTLDFKVRSNKTGRIQENAAARLIRELSQSYDVESDILKASDFGVPQHRNRFILIATRKDSNVRPGALSGLEQTRATILAKYGLPSTNTASDAISDLEIARNELIPCQDSKGFQAVGYVAPLTAYQRAMRDGFEGRPSDTRLANHTQIVRERFSEIISICKSENRLAVQLSKEVRAQLGIKKMATRVLDPGSTAPTVTSMPDDLIHYSEPRTLSVRENARLQSFPDWFVFRGKYTSGGHRRKIEVPRFTQVANAVPPLLAEIIGTRILKHSLNRESTISST